jgi:translation initiation factor 2A
MADLLQFAYRTQKTIGVTDAAPVYEPLSGFVKPEGNLRCCVYSPCGRYLAYASSDGVTVVDCRVGDVVTSLPLTMVYELSFSPQGTFLSTWERPSKDEAGDATKNFNVWRTIEDLAEGVEKQQPLGRFAQKSQSGWNLQYTTDERFCARLVTNEVQFYDSNDLTTVWNKLRVEGVSDFAIAPGQSHNVAVFIPERKVSLNILAILPPRRSRPLIFLAPGTTCRRQGVQCASVRQPHLPEDLFQRRQGSAEVERSGHEPDCVGANRRG